MTLFLLLLLLLPLPSLSQPTNSSSSSSSCPLDFTILNKFIAAAASNPSSIPSDSPTRCSYARQALHLVQSQHLKTHSLFFPPSPSPLSSSSCFSSFQTLTSRLLPSFSLLSSCGFSPSSSFPSSPPCSNVSSRSDFESLLPSSALSDLFRYCNLSLSDPSSCTACTTSLNRARAFLPGPDHGNVTTCSDLPFIYAAGVVNPFGPSDSGTALCLFLLPSQPNPSPPIANSTSSTAWIYGVVTGCVILLLLLSIAIWVFVRRRAASKKKLAMARITNTPNPALDSISASTSLVRFTFEEIKAATKNFARDNIIGSGGYGNVYRGFLADGSEVAMKRFKNCSAAGNASFAHEVEVIASVRHVNLVALRGYCTATSAMEGHQRVIVCELMRNGSLHDHLFGSEEGRRRLSWPIRQNVAVGMARGLAYLHYGAQPAIIHRDIKASNVLLDEMFEPKVADFGLARFAPEGMSHVSTRVAGTLGYVAPEYALYGQLTEKSDVYSFGVVMLELLSGKKAFLSTGDGQNSLLTDWAWSLVRKGKALDVIEEGMEELGPRDVMEKYVLVSVLSSHPQLHARPTMDQIVKILETDLAVPTIPDRPLPLVANMDEIEKSVSSSGSGQLSSFAGYQPFALGTDDEILIDQKGSDHSSPR